MAAAPSFEGNGGWRSWDLFESTTVAPASPNTLLAFAPHERSYHAVRMDIPADHPRRERTAIRGFIRAGAATENWVYPYRSRPRQIAASATTVSKKVISRAVRRGRRTATHLGLDRPEIDTLVVSAGGASTTQLLEFLGSRVAVNDRNSYVDGLKHLNRPTHPLLERVPVQRAVYLVADPREVVLSLFRRDYAAEMVGKLSAEHTTPLAYRRHVDRHLDERFDLDALLQGDEDPFALGAHWRAWTSDQPPFPVLTVRYDELPSAVPEILDFVGLPRDLAADFPAWVPRASKLAEQPASVRDGLDRLYGDLAAEIAAHPAWQRRG